MDYSYQDMVKMQEDAAKRVQDMRRRAKKYVMDEYDETNITSARENNSPPVIPDKVRVISMPVEELTAQPEKREEVKQNPPTKAADSGIASLINSDSALILSLCMLLQAEKADEGLIMSLLYLLV